MPGFGCVEYVKLEARAAVSTDRENPGGKMAADAMLAQAKSLLDTAAVDERTAQMDLMEPLTAEETAEAQEELGPQAGPLSVVRHARNKREAGRPKGARNRRTADFEQYISQFGPDPAVVLAKIVGETEEAMIERSRALDPSKRQMTFADARAMRIRAAETLMPYRHGKQPVKVDATIRGVLVREEIGDLRGVRGRMIEGDVLGLLPIDDEGGAR